MVYLGDSNGGFYGSNYIGNIGRFLGVGDGVASIGDATTQKISEPQQVTGATLEETLKIINNPDMNRADMVEAVHKVYKA